MTKPILIRLRIFIKFLLIYALLWIIITSGNLESWLVGVFFVLSATMVSIVLLPANPVYWRTIRIIHFIPFFIWQSLLGGYTVAKLAFAGSLSFQPLTMEYHTRLPDSASRVFFSSVASLLPGTLVINIDGNRLLVHGIDTSIDVKKDLAKLERQVARIFAIELAEGEKCHA